jgi:hypothetical protein
LGGYAVSKSHLVPIPTLKYYRHKPKVGIEYRIWKGRKGAIGVKIIISAKLEKECSNNSPVNFLNFE